MDGKTIMLLQYLHLHLHLHVLKPRSMMILIAGPYRSAPATIRRASPPTSPRWKGMRCPLVHAAGSQAIGDAVYDALFHPHCERLLSHCDAVLRVGGPSAGADRMVAAAGERGLLIFRDLTDIPCAAA